MLSRRKIPPAALLASVLLFLSSGLHSESPPPRGLDRIQHIVVIYLENRSFDSLFRDFPGADTSATAVFAPQTDGKGQEYPTLPRVIRNEKHGPKRLSEIDPRFPENLPNAPFLIDRYVPLNEIIPDLRHRFYPNQWQINRGKNDRFVAYTDAGGLPMGYSDTSGLRMWEYARKFVLCDRFFMAAFGGSFLNHQWLIAAATPRYANAPPELIMKNEKDPVTFVDNIVTSDGHAVNTIHPQWPTTEPATSRKRLPLQTHATIGDRLSQAGIRWKWYSTGWNMATVDPARAAGPDLAFQFHHQPFAYFKTCAKGTVCFEKNIKDREDLLADIRANDLPAVSFFKPGGNDNGHPGEATIKRSDEELATVVDAIMQSQMWENTAIIVTWDENGGMWDHVAPPVIDRWGPGSRVPTIVISPFAKRGFVDHTTYDTTSILALIESRYHLKPLSARDGRAANLLNAFQ